MRQACPTGIAVLLGGLKYIAKDLEQRNVMRPRGRTHCFAEITALTWRCSGKEIRPWGVLLNLPQ